MAPFTASPNGEIIDNAHLEGSRDQIGAWRGAAFPLTGAGVPTVGGTSCPGLDPEGVAVPLNLSDLTAREVGGEDERVRVRGAGKNLLTGTS